MNIAVNGFGRIGRLFVRACIERGEQVNIVAVNDLTSSEDLAYLFKYDTTYGTFEGQVEATGDVLTIEYQGKTQTVKVFSQKDPASLPWGELEVDVVVESTGLFLTRELASKHLEAGAKKVVMSAPSKSSDIPTVVLGVTDIPSKEQIISNASCTTNCIAPAIYAIDQAFAITSISGITVHAYTASQNLQDGPNKHMRSGRAAATNIVPASTGADSAVVSAIPNIAGKLSMSAVRVPVITGSYVFLNFTLDQEISKDKIEEVLKNFADAHPTIMHVTSDPLVSSDIVGLPYSSIVDLELLKVTQKNQFELHLWYDNEWGYTNRLVDVVLGT